MVQILDGTEEIQARTFATHVLQHGPDLCTASHPRREPVFKFGVGRFVDVGSEAEQEKVALQAIQCLAEVVAFVVVC